MNARYGKIPLNEDTFSDVKITKSTTERRASVRLSQRAFLKSQELKPSSVSASIFLLWLRIFDFAMIALACLSAYWGTQNSSFEQFDNLYMIAITIGCLGGITLFEIFSCYNIQSLRSLFDQLSRMIGAWLCLFAILATIAFLTKSGANFSRMWLSTWFLLGAMIFVAARISLVGVVILMTRRGKLQRRAVIVGGGQNAADLINSLGASVKNDIQIVGIFDDRAEERSVSNLGEYEKLGNVAELVEFVRKTQIDMLIVTLPLTSENRVLELLKQLWVLPVDIRLAAHNSKLRFRPRTYSYIGSTPFIDVMDRPIAEVNSFFKRCFDLVLSIFFIVLLSPIMLATYIAVRLDSKGPAIFKQTRHGFNNDEVTVFKFRSMQLDSCDNDSKKLVTKNDPRVTRVGKFIRKTSIDELPQFFNVLRGELSLVGPRPHAISAHMHNTRYENIVESYFARHRVKPGLTGWAQVNGYRGEIDVAEKIQKRVEHDLYYIENWSVLFDLYIVLITPWKIIFDTENAY